MQYTAYPIAILLTSWRQSMRIGPVCGYGDVQPQAMNPSSPTKRKRAGPMRQFIPRKPHSTGIKLYVLGDSVHPFITDVFLYAGKRVRIFREREQVVGPRTAREMVHRWVDLLPNHTAIVCDSYLGSHMVANQIARRRHPFLFLCKRDQEGVSLAGDVLRASRAAETYVKGGKYSIHVYENPKVGSKPPRVVPFMTNCEFDDDWVNHRGGYSLPPIVAAHGQLANGVDSANQLALEHRETSRFKTWTRALKVCYCKYVNTVQTPRSHSQKEIPLGNFGKSRPPAARSAHAIACR